MLVYQFQIRYINTPLINYINTSHSNLGITIAILTERKLKKTVIITNRWY